MKLASGSRSRTLYDLLVGYMIGVRHTYLTMMLVCYNPGSRLVGISRRKRSLHSGQAPRIAWTSPSESTRAWVDSFMETVASLQEKVDVLSKARSQCVINHYLYCPRRTVLEI